MPATEATSKYIQAVYAAVRSGQLSANDAAVRLGAAKEGEELRLKMSRQRFGTDSSERASVRNRERWHHENIQALQAAKEILEQGVVPELEP